MKNYQAEYSERTVPYELQMIVEAELHDDEQLLWSGQPNPKRLMLRAMPIVLFAVPWTAFAVFWMCGAAGFKVPDFKDGQSFFPLFGIPFVLIGIFMLCSPLLALRKARRTIYAVTDQRAIIFQKGTSLQIESFGPDDLGDTIKRLRNDGSGDLILEQRVTYRQSKHGSRQRIKEIGFFGVEQVNDVEDKLRQITIAHSNDN